VMHSGVENGVSGDVHSGRGTAEVGGSPEAEESRFKENGESGMKGCRGGGRSLTKV